MCLKIREFLRQFDALAQPVRMSHKNESEFNTGIGGCLTIITMLSTLSYLIISSIQLFVDPNYALSQVCSIKNFFLNDGAFTLDTLQYNVAFSMSNKSKDGTPSGSLARVQYYLAELKVGDDSATEQWINTIPCKDLFHKLASQKQIDIWKQSPDWDFLESEIFQDGSGG